MLELSPFGDELPAEDRVNLWPLWYADGARRSLLWPFVDWDDEGFAVRPLVARDGDELDLLWPLAHVELDTGDFWALTAYSLDDAHGLFPLVGWGELGYVGPLWWADASDDASDDSDDGLDAYGLFPLVWRSREPDTTVVAPLWWQFGDVDAGRGTRVLFPLWWESGDVEHDVYEQTLFPLWHYGRDRERRRFVTPLGGRGWSGDGSTRFVNVLGPVFHRSVEDERSFTAVAWPLFTAERAPGESSTAVWPLWSHERRDAEGERPRHEQHALLAGALRRARDGDDVAWRAWPLVSATANSAQQQLIDHFALVGVHRRATGSTLQLGTPLLFQLDRWDLDAARHGANGGADEDRAAGGDGSWEAHVATLLSFGHDATPSWHHPALEEVRAVDPEASVARDHAGLLFDWFLWETTSVSGPATVPSTVARHSRVPLLFEYESEPDATEWDALLWCLHSKRWVAEEHFVAGWGLYRSVVWGEQREYVSRDLFPFVSYDAGPDRTSVSFLWRLWHHERRGDRRGGHLLFIPWGDDL